MAWHLQLGFDDRVMQKVNTKEADRQKYIFSILTTMLVVIGLLVFFSSLVYMLVIFHNWLLGILTGLFLAIVVFNIYRFLIVSSVNASYSGLKDFINNHERAYDEYFDNDIDFANISEEQIQHTVNAKKEELRSVFSLTRTTSGQWSNGFFTMLVRVLFITLFAVIFATGIELFIFKGVINYTLEETRSLLMSEQPDSWTLKEILTAKQGDNFVLLNSSSLLLLLDILLTALGNWKLLFDLIILVIFLMPLILVFRSREILFGSYVRELALHEIAISHYHYLKTQKYCAITINEIKSKNDQIIKSIKQNG
jgi:hypothetical protein